jgi:hypothetical protein
MIILVSMKERCLAISLGLVINILLRIMILHKKMLL